MITYYLIGAAALFVVLTIVGILSRYKKCRSDEVLVVYGKTSGNSSAKCYHGGAAFVWPVIQGYKIMSMKPMQIQCDLKGALSSQKIKVDVPTVVTVAISEKSEIMTNAAVRLLSLTETEKEDQIKDVIWGQMRLVVAEMTVEQLISDRDNFLGSCRTNIDAELAKFGLSLININISDISDDAQYIENLGKEAAAKAKYEALTSIEKREKEGSIGIANQKKEKDTELSKIEKDRSISVAENDRDREIRTAEIDKETSTVTATTRKEKDIELRDIQKDKAVRISEKEKEETIAIREVEKQKTIETSNLEKDEAVKVAEITKEQEIQISVNQAEQAQKVAEQERLRDAEVARQKAERDTEVATHNATRDAKVAEKNAESKTAQEKAKYEASASITEAQQESEARQVAAGHKAEAEKVKAEQEKESNIADYEASTRQRKAEADKTAKLTENKAGIEVAKSDATLGKEQAEAEKTIGEAKAKAEEAVGKANANKEKEIAKAEAEAEKARLDATVIVKEQKEAERKKTEAQGYKDKVIMEAEADAEAIKIKAAAEAEKIRATMLAEAEGKLKMAEVKKQEIAAETANICALKEAGMGDEAIVQWTLKEEYKLIAEADAKKFEHVQTGNVTVVGGAGEAGNFMLDTVRKISEVSSVKDMIPGLPGLFAKADNWSKKHIEAGKENEEKENFDEVK